MLGLMWRAKARLLDPLHDPQPGLFLSDRLHFPELQAVLSAGGPELQPYQGMAEMWEEYGAHLIAGYTQFLVALARRRGTELQSVLDIACGAGVLAYRLADAVSDVVGLDASEPMLAVARRYCKRLPGVRFVHGDFRQFSLDRQFDSVVCTFNSLNYVADRSDLTRVFAAVAEHLRPGGTFVFDTVTGLRMSYLSGRFLHREKDGSKFAIRFRYDSYMRRETSLAILPTGIETHRRIPIDPEDVEAAVEGTGLVVSDYFSSAFIPGWWWTGMECFFVLTKRR